MPLSQTAMRFHGQLAYHDFEGPAIDGDECARIVRDLGSFSAMVLRNHGLLVCGVSIAQANTELKAIGARLSAQYPENKDKWFGSLPFVRRYLGSQVTNTVRLFTTVYRYSFAPYSRGTS